MSTTTRRYLGALMLGLAGSVLWIGAVPSWHGWRDLKVALVAHQSALTERQAAVANRTSVLGTYNTHARDVQQLAMLIPAKRSEPEMIVTIENIAQDSGVSVDALRVTAAKDSRTIPATMAVTVQAKGSYPSLLGFIGDLERNLRLIDIQSVALTPGSALILAATLMRLSRSWARASTIMS